MGCPRLRWGNLIVSDLRHLGVPDPDQWMHVAQNRRRWRGLVMAAKDQQLLLPRVWVSIVYLYIRLANTNISNTKFSNNNWE